MEATNTTAVVSKERATAELTKKTQEWISTAIANEEIKCPKGYDYKGELFLGMIMLSTEVKDRNGRYAIEVCTPASIMSEFKLMVKNGWSLARKQCYAIVYGDKLSITPSYFGDISTIERAIPGAKVSANVIHEGDEYDYTYNEDTGTFEVTNIHSKLENSDKPIVAAFGCVKVEGKKITTDVMTWKKIQASWSHAKTDNVQKLHPEDMAKRTLIRHMCKTILNTTKGVDSDLVAAYNEVDSNENDFSEPKNITPGKEKGGARFDKLMEEAVEVDSDKTVAEVQPQEIPF